MAIRHAGFGRTLLPAAASLACAVLAPCRLSWPAALGAEPPSPTQGPAPTEIRAETQANVPVELTFHSAVEYADPFNSVRLDVIFTTPGGRALVVPAFWAGGGAWRVRYASPFEGVHPFRTHCSDQGNAGLHGVAGKVMVRPYRGENPLLRHGPIRVAADRRHFEHLDGTPFLWIGDTWWMGLSGRLHWPGEFQRLAQDRRQKGFNVIQIVAGLYPDMPPFDPRGANEAGFPWKEDYSSIRPEYFDRADERIGYLVDQGFVPCMVGAWGYHIKWMGAERMKQHWRYLIARYGAMPVVWCIAGEANLPYYLAEGFPYDDRQQVEAWTPVARDVRRTDPFRRPISIHPTGLGRLSARGAIGEVGLLDFDMLQTGHGDLASLGPTIETARFTYAASPTMPFLNSEVCYEGILGACPASVQRLMAWSCLLSGAAGHTYGANGIWQLNRKGEPYGKSPHGGDYGPVPWDEAMNLPGSAQVGLAGRILGQYPWHQFEPHPEWAAFVSEGKPYMTPYAAGMPDGRLRMIYFPAPQSAVLKALEPGAEYSANTIDPITGKIEAIAPIRTDARGQAPAPLPARSTHDWLLVLQRQS